MLQAFDIIHVSFDLDKNPLRLIDTKSQIAYIKRLQKLGIFAYFFVTIHKKNKDLIDDIVSLTNNNEIPISFNMCCNNHQNEKYLLSKDECIEIINKLLCLEKSGMIRPFKHPYVNVLRDLSSENYIGNRGGCTAGIASCVIKANGDVIPCPFLRIPSGNIYEDNIETIWENSDLLRSLRNRSLYKTCGQCKHVSYCGGCRKNALDHSGKITGYDTNCILTNLLLNERKGIYDNH